jgi:hypothetical protein
VALVIQATKPSAKIQSGEAHDGQGDRGNRALLGFHFHHRASSVLALAIYDTSAFTVGKTGNILTATLADYLPLTAREIPPIEIYHLETLTEASITKAKGLGEGGTIGAPAAVVNAINDALSPFGVSIDEFPATPQRHPRGAARRVFVAARVT